MGTSIQVTVSAAAGYTLDQEQTVFDLAVDDAVCATPPVVVTAVAPTFTDPCGPDNELLTLPVTEGVTYTQQTVGNVITVTATANAGFVLAAPATFSFTVNDAVCATDDDEVLGESGNGGNNNSGTNNGGNNNGGTNNAAATAAPTTAAPTTAVAPPRSSVSRRSPTTPRWLLPSSPPRPLRSRP